MKNIIILLLLTFATHSLADYTNNFVNLKNVQVLTFRNGEMTNYRRTSPIKQMNCIGGDACSKSNTISTAQCKNMGSDGNDINWKCKASMGKNLRLGKTIVSCEGYNFPSDRYITVGSCGLKYELFYTEHPDNNVNNHNYKRYIYKQTSSKNNDDELILLISGLLISSFIAMFAYSCYKGFCDNNRVRIQRRRNRLITDYFEPVDSTTTQMQRHVQPVHHVHEETHVYHNTPSYGITTTPTSDFTTGFVLGSLNHGPGTHTTERVEVYNGGNSSSSTSDTSRHRSTSFATTERR